jgi:hypothetical protein
MPLAWPALPPYGAWAANCDTLHAHTQVLGKLAAALAPAEPQLQHTALRLTVRGWETLPLPAPDGSGALAVALDLRTHQAVVEHSDGRVERVALTPNRPVGEVTRDVLAAVRGLAGPVEINPRPQETPWTTPLDQDDEHATYDPAQVTAYFAAAARAALVLSALRAPYRGRSSPVNAWWGSFDLAVSLFSGRPAEPSSGEFIMRNAGNAQQIEVGWWPGDGRYPRAAFFAYATPRPRDSRPRRCHRRPPAGTPGSVNTCSTGTTPAPVRIPTAPRSSSASRRSGMRARSAAGIRRCLPVCRGFPRRSPDRPDR